VDNHQNFGGNNHSRLILQCCRHALDQVKQALAARPNVCAMLDVFGRPIPLKGCRKPLGSVCILLESLPLPLFVMPRFIQSRGRRSTCTCKALARVHIGFCSVFGITDRECRNA
jgi:hypothetical protein